MEKANQVRRAYHKVFAAGPDRQTAGVKIVVDAGRPAIEAKARNVARVSYATSLMKQGVLISTTEHLLSAFVGMGIDDAIVELDNLELPILDGSARPFVDLIRRVGVRKQRRPRSFLRILRPLELREGNKFIGVYPSDRYSVSCTIDFPHPLIGRESRTLELTNGQYVSEIASARTFGFLISSAGAGSLLGSLFLTTRSSIDGLACRVSLAAASAGAALTLFALNSHHLLAYPILMVLGFSMVLVVAGSNTLLQSWVRDDMRGRVMGIYMLVCLGGAPLGSPLSGLVAEHFGTRMAMIAGGLISVAATVVVGILVARYRGVPVRRYLKEFRPVRAAA